MVISVCPRLLFYAQIVHDATKMKNMDAMTENICQELTVRNQAISGH